MDKNISILIYEKENHLNSILYQQVSDNDNYDTYSVIDPIKLSKLVNEKKFDICIFNVEDIEPIFKNLSNDLLEKNRHVDIVGYCNKLHYNKSINNLNITLIEKPFRLKFLLEKLEYIKLTKNKSNKTIFIKHIEFLPNKKILFNSKTKITIHLTEKENYLLNFLYNKRNLEFTKNDLLIDVWGVTERINTHTLETHLYRLKQKLFKLDPNLTFSLINQNGLYTFEYS
ncbi:helix-turn-helix domain-containing protein [Alphaproteobacteria bacterium]|nr:helix-turn-helix domain-containing protein [Alphaproteobacteria bacterium]